MYACVQVKVYSRMAESKSGSSGSKSLEQSFIDLRDEYKVVCVRVCVCVCV